jgi:hypothetical protein
MPLADYFRQTLLATSGDLSPWYLFVLANLMIGMLPISVEAQSMAEYQTPEPLFLTATELEFNVDRSDETSQVYLGLVNDGSRNPLVNEAPLRLAAPENLNPGLYIPPPPPLPTEPEQSDIVPPDTAEETLPFVPIWEVDNLTVDFSDDYSNFGQDNQFFEPTVTGTFPNGDRLAITTGLNTFIQPDVPTVANLPVKAAWTREMGDFTTTIGGGIDFFAQLPAALNFEVSTSVPLGDQAILSFFVEQGPYKFNATTLNNQITAGRYGPNLFWQIAPGTTFFSLVRWGRYNDGNREQQSFSRFEQRFGDFSFAINGFNWRYREEVSDTSGYFSPPDFLVLNGEIAWQGDLFDWLSCRLAASVGRQRLNADWTGAESYNSLCTFQLSETLEFDLGYAFSNVVSQAGGSAFNNRSIVGAVRAQF